jgi:phosphate starvation-inducible protein PhoH
MASNRHTDEVFTPKRKPKNPIKFQLQLNEEQKLAKALIVENPVVVLKGMAGSGKAQPLTSRVYTPKGVTTMGELKVGDIILGRSGTTTVLGIYPQGVENVYQITLSDESTVQCSLEHLWTVQQKRYSSKQLNWKVLTTGELLKDLEKGIEYRLPNLETPLAFEEKPVALDPYIVGVLLSEGHIREDVVTLSTNEPEVLQEINSILEETSTELIHVVNYDYRFRRRKRNNTPNTVVEACKELKLSGKTSYDKFIPEEYRYNSEKNRIRLLQGLVDGDGYVTKGGSLLYNTRSKQLAEDVKEMFQSLGGRVTVLKYFPKYNYRGVKKTSLHLHYQLSITIEHPERFTTIPFKKERLQKRERKVKYTSRVIKSIKKVGQAQTQCIQVSASDSLYVTDNCILTHNTLVAVQAALDMLFCKEVEKIIITRPTVAKEELGFLPGDLKEKMDPWLAPIYHNLYMLYGKDKVDREIEDGNIEIVPFAFMRGRTFVNSFVIVDEAQNVTHDQMETVLGRLGKGSKMVVCGDLAQIDLKIKKETGFSFLTRIEEQVPGFKIFALKANHRHEIVSPILKVYQDFRD